MAARAERVLVWGGGGHARVVADVVRSAGHEVAGFVDRRADYPGRELLEPDTLVPEPELIAHVERGTLPLDATAIALGIGDNGARMDAFTRLAGAHAPPFVHAHATVSPSARLGRGTVVMARAVINAHARIGDAVIVNSGAIVEHDCRLGDACHVSPSATLAGAARVGARSWIGAGAVVLPGIVIGDDATIGAGAAVTRDIGNAATVVGVPARAVPR